MSKPARKARAVPAGDPGTELLDALRALDNERRLQILRWLRDPTRHFRPQIDGDLVEDGVCGLLIAEKLGVSQPTVSEHMRLLVRAGLVRPKRIKQWTFYRRDDERLAEVLRALRAL
ncbi:MAG TPA: metalloregulator ArsR/SmtB family transcription factor [Myxococcaceae bacterium]|nr:metalloregulator ArsR/SmtB family transcription factor [Myxococcaceae bacterium]